MLNIDFPFHFDSRGQTAVTGDNDHIRDMIEQFLFTNPGERVNRPDFGSGILQLIFASNSPELASTLETTIRAGLNNSLFDLIVIQDLQVTSDESSLYIKLSYLVTRTQELTSTTFTRGIDI